MIEQFFFEGLVVWIKLDERLPPLEKYSPHFKERLPIKISVNYSGILLCQEEPIEPQTIPTLNGDIFACSKTTLWHWVLSGQPQLKRRLHVLWAQNGLAEVLVYLTSIRGPEQLSPNEEFDMQQALGVHHWGKSPIASAISAMQQQRLQVGTFYMSNGTFQAFKQPFQAFKQPPAQAASSPSGPTTGCKACGAMHVSLTSKRTGYCLRCWKLKNAPKP